MSMTPENIADAVVHALDRRRSITDLQHEEHHHFVQVLIRREEARTAFWVEMRQHVAKAGVLAMASVLVYALWLLLRQKLGLGI